jgi:hypothetical protein
LRGNYRIVVYHRSGRTRKSHLQRQVNSRWATVGRYHAGLSLCPFGLQTTILRNK